MNTRILKFGEVTREPDIRYAKDMAEVIIDKNWLRKNQNAELYYMYRDLWKKEDREKILSKKLRYDITIIPSRDMGEEFVKTKGHYHPPVAEKMSYPELYEVLEGKAHYLLQKKSQDQNIEDVVLIVAEKGEKVLIPPNYGHITINPSNDTLKMANWVNRNFDSIYGEIIEYGGGAYFELTTGEFIKNDNYDNIPEIRKINPTNLPEMGIESEKNMYSLIEKPESLEFLNNPQEFKSLFKRIL